MATSARSRTQHPGRILRLEYLDPNGITVNALAVALGVPGTRLHEIVHERRGVSPDTAARLARYFGGDAAQWLAWQAEYDLKTLDTRAEIDKQIKPFKRGR